MNALDLSRCGVQGTTAEADPHHFQGKLNRVTIEGNEDYRLVLFFIKKGTVMPLHDHPNMSVYFKLMFGKLDYHVFDKVDEKFRYNQLSDMEYQELMETKAKISAKKSAPKLLEKNNLLLVRPSCGNMHKFVAREDSCFFDICLPNYTSDAERRITYFNEVSTVLNCDGLPCSEVTDENEETAHVPLTGKADKGNTALEYHATPPVLPAGFTITELNYSGEMNDTEMVLKKPSSNL